MSIPKLLLCIFLMMTVSYLPRMIPLAIFRKKIKNPYIQSFLSYMPYAVLGAMTFPDILFSTASIFSALAGLAVALLLSYFEKGLMPSALGATAAVFIVEQAVQFFTK